jgi:meso-butanediol dehydrogenase/(S,S)-butanediol dehydrogenase/diacetyl reductase
VSVAQNQVGPITLDFTGKRVVVTGGTRGIGRAIVDAYCASGARVVMNGSSEQSVEKAMVDAADGIVGVAASVSDPEQCHKLMAEAVEHLGGIDVLVNNAGVSQPLPIEMVDVDSWNAQVNTSLQAAFFCTQAALPSLRESKGNVLNIASVYGVVGSAYTTAYSAAKGGLVNLTRSMALELAPDIRVNCLCPGGVDTDMLRDLAVAIGGSVEAGYDVLKQDAAQKRIAAPYEIAAAALWLTSAHASFVTGSIHVVDGGETAD